MQVLDIIQSAAFKSGIVSSFNPDEMPGDIIDAGRRILTEEILPTLNCDRMIDITVTARKYDTSNGIINLIPYTPIPDFRIIGYSKHNSKVEFSDLETEIKERTPEYIDENGVWKWPVSESGAHIRLAMWSTDTRLIYIQWQSQSIQIKLVLPDVNIDFPPMRIDGILDADSKVGYTYQYRSEFEQSFNTVLPGIYTVEEHSNGLTILLKGTSQPKLIILPVPLQIINSDFDNAGEILAPPKFKRYLIDALAVSLAIVYGVSTVEMMKEQAAVSYNLLKKNKPQPLHEQNINQAIADKLRNPRGRGTGWGNPWY